MNSLNFIGNCGKDAETRFTQNGKSVTSFSVAMNSGWGDRQTTTWVNCTMWGERGEKVAPYIVKGQKVGITGEASLREWESNGKSGTSFECNVQNVTLCGEKRMQQAAPQPAPAGNGPSDFENSDVPFSNYQYKTLA